MKVLLTGADGFLGSHILRCLLDADHTVRAFLQKNRDQATINGLDYEAFYGDLLNDIDIDNALNGCDAVIHTVAITDLWPCRNPLIWKINYEATKKLAELVTKHHTKRFIYIGTANSFGFGTKSSPGDEFSPYSADVYGLDYMDSKKAIQDFLLEEHRNNHLPVVIINPSFMIGEYDTKPGSGAMILSIVNRKLPSYAPGGRCFTYVNDVAVAIVNSLIKGRPGECYIAGGFNLNYQEFFNLVGKTAGVKPPQHKIPLPILYVFGWLAEVLCKITKKPPLLSMSMIRISRDGHYYCSEKAIQELDMPRTSIETAVERTLKWFRANNYC